MNTSQSPVENNRLYTITDLVAVFVLDLEHPVWVAAWIQFSGYENDAEIWAFESIC